jgi:hypothetical protein
LLRYKISLSLPTAHLLLPSDRTVNINFARPSCCCFIVEVSYYFSLICHHTKLRDVAHVGALISLPHLKFTQPPCRHMDNRKLKSQEDGVASSGTMSVLSQPFREQSHTDILFQALCGGTQQGSASFLCYNSPEPDYCFDLEIRRGESRLRSG